MSGWGRGGNHGLGFIAGAVAGGGVATGTLAGASWAAVAVPIIGPALVGVALAVSAMLKRNAQNKIRATQVVDAVEPYMAQNRDAYLSGPRNRAAQTQALANFDAMWADVVRACSDPSLGGPGERCISERQPGGQWDWFSYYRDPIAGDTAVVDDPVITDPASAFFGPLVQAVNGSPYRAYLPVAAVALVGLGLWSLGGDR